MVFLNPTDPFPHPNQANPNGLLAIGASLSPAKLLEAYNHGIFPWYSQGQPIMWYCPNPRMVLYLDQFKTSKSLQKTLKKQTFQVSFNNAFTQVITQCAHTKRAGQYGTWITPQMIHAYQQLHTQGHAQSVEVWNNNKLVGGLYGINLPQKKIFCGESMFHTQTDASKIALYHLVQHLKTKHYQLIDCQVHTHHLASLGAQEISRTQFLKHLHNPSIY